MSSAMILFLFFAIIVYFIIIYLYYNKKKYKLLIMIQTIISIMLFVFLLFTCLDTYVTKYYSHEYLSVLSDRIIMLLENNRAPAVLRGLKEFKKQTNPNHSDNYTALMNYLHVECKNTPLLQQSKSDKTIKKTNNVVGFRPRVIEQEN